MLNLWNHRVIRTFRYRKSTMVSYQNHRANMVRVTGLEPAASWSQTTRATSCATPGNILFYKFCGHPRQCKRAANAPTCGIVAKHRFHSLCSVPLRPKCLAASAPGGASAFVPAAQHPDIQFMKGFCPCTDYNLYKILIYYTAGACFVSITAIDLQKRLI